MSDCCFLCQDLNPVMIPGHMGLSQFSKPFIDRFLWPSFVSRTRHAARQTPRAWKVRKAAGWPHKFNLPPASRSTFWHSGFLTRFSLSYNSTSLFLLNKDFLILTEATLWDLFIIVIAHKKKKTSSAHRTSRLSAWGVVLFFPVFLFGVNCSHMWDIILDTRELRNCGVFMKSYRTLSFGRREIKGSQLRRMYIRNACKASFPEPYMTRKLTERWKFFTPAHERVFINSSLLPWNSETDLKNRIPQNQSDTT